MVALAKLVARETDSMGYTTYVFEILDEEIRKITKYIMCTQFYNWDHRLVELDEIGYLNCIEIQAGIDKWFNGSTMIPYNYNMVQFIKFISKPKKESHEFIM